MPLAQPLRYALPQPKHPKKRSLSPIPQRSPSTIPDNQKRSHPTKTSQKAIALSHPKRDRTPPEHLKKRSLLSHPTAIALARSQSFALHYSRQTKAIAFSHPRRDSASALAELRSPLFQTTESRCRRARRFAMHPIRLL